MKIFKKWWFWLILIIILIGGICTYILSQNEWDIQTVLTGETKQVRIAKSASMLDWDKVHDEIIENGAKTGDYNGKWYIYSGRISNIESSSFYIFNETYEGKPLNSITVNMDSSMIKKLSSNQAITVVGKFYSSSGHFFDLNDAFIFPEELYSDKQFIIELLSSQDRTYMPHYYKDYEFDLNGNKTKYTEISYSYTIRGSYEIHKQDIDRHTLKYNNKNQLILDSEKKYVDKGSGEITAGQTSTKYTYNADGFIDTITVPSIWKGEKYSTYKFTYEKDKNGKIVKGTEKGSRFGETKIEYDSNGNKTKEITPTVTKIYKYKDGRLVNKKSTYNNSDDVNEDTTYYYGVVAKK